jgi:hypothetical protein
MDTDRTLKELLEQRYKNYSMEICDDLSLAATVVANKASPEQIESFNSHLATCEECREDVEWYNRLETEGVFLEQKAQVIPHPGSWAGIWQHRRLIAAAACILILITVSVWIFMDRPSGHPSGLEIKGPADDVIIAVQRGIKRFRARAEDRLQPGDRLGFFYTATTPGYIMLLDVQEDGQVTMLTPAGKTKSTPIEMGSEIALPDGGVVEEIKGCSWLVALFSDRALNLSEIRPSIMKALELRKGCRLDIHTPLARTVWTHSVNP